jgi:hypothetical protein
MQCGSNFAVNRLAASHRRGEPTLKLRGVAVAFEVDASL